MVKKLIITTIFVIMLIVTVYSAMAFSIDSDDNFYLNRGETVNGMFIIEDYNNNIILQPSSSWIIIVDKINIIDNVYSIQYEVSVPEKTDINVYREQIVVSDGSETKIMNVKISVQNSFFKSLFTIFSNPNYIWYSILFILLVMMVMLYFVYQGVR